MVRDFLRTLFYLLPESLQERILRAQLIKRILRVVLLRRLWMRRLKANLLPSKSLKRYLFDDTVYWIDPQKIVYATREFDIHEYKGKVIGGDWDRLEIKFNELDVYSSYEERASKGTSWERLPYYKRVLDEIEKGIPKWGCKNRQDLDKRCQMLDEIFEDIKQSGYKSQVSLGKEKGKNSLLDSEDEITVNIGRDGDLLFNGGRHRLTFAKIAGIKKIPVKITVRHIEWEAFKKEIEMYAQRHNGKVYAPLTHVDLQTIPTHYTDERFEMIRSNVGKGNSTLLDIGAHWSYFCHKFEEEGFHCFAVENDEENLYFLRKLRRAENKKFAVIPESIFALSQKEPLKYDIVLALAIFHHFLKEESSFQKLKLLLKSLDVNEMYFEPHLSNEPQMKGAFVNFSPEEFADFIVGNSCLSNHKLIGKCEDGRLIYKLWR